MKDTENFRLVQTSGRLAIQLRVGRLPSGRDSHRTISIKDIRPDAPREALVRAARAVAAIAAYPVTKVRFVTKSRFEWRLGKAGISPARRSPAGEKHAAAAAGFRARSSPRATSPSQARRWTGRERAPFFARIFSASSPAQTRLAPARAYGPP